MSWQQLSGPSAGSAALFTLLPNGDVIASSDRLYISTDKGLFWSAFSPSFDNNGWVGRASVVVNSKGDIFADGDPGIYRTTDHGASWQHIATTTFPLYATGAIMIDKNDYLYRIADSVGQRLMFRSTDNGDTWSSLPQDFRQSRNELYAAPTGTLYAAEYTGLMRSTDQGLSWTRLQIDTEIDLRIDGLGGADSDIFVVCHNEIYRSSDDGLTWALTMNGLPSFRYIYSFSVCRGGLMLSGTGTPIFRSIDRGDHWSQAISIPDTGGATVSTAMLSIDDSDFLVDLYSGGYYGVYGSDDAGQHLRAYQTGMLNAWVQSVTTDQSGEIFAWAVPTGILSSTDNGSSWTKHSLPDDSMESYLGTLQAGYRGDLYLSSFNGSYRSTDAGVNWTKLASGPANSLGQFVTPANNGALYAYTFDSNQSRTRILRSTDFGTNWIDITSNLDGTRIYGGMAVDSSGNVYVALYNTVVTHGNESDMYQDATIAVSTDQGQSWSRNSGLAVALAGTFPHYVGIQNIVIDPSGDIVVAHSNGTAISTNHGLSWSVSPYMEETQAVATNSKGHLFIGTRAKGLFESTDMGDTWTNISGIVPKTGTSSLYIDPNDYLMVGAGGSWIYRSTQQTNSIHHLTVASAAPAAFAVDQNYPNPAKSITSIPFTLTRDADVRWTLTNVTGREVLSHAEHGTAGSHTLTIPVETLPAGTYQFTFTAEGEHITRVISVVR